MAYIREFKGTHQVSPAPLEGLMERQRPDQRMVAPLYLKGNTWSYARSEERRKEIKRNLAQKQAEEVLERKEDLVNPNHFEKAVGLISDLID